MVLWHPRCLLAGVFAIGVATAQSPASTSPRPDPQLAGRLDAAIDTAGKDLWGIALASIDGKVIWSAARGQQDRVRVPIDRKSLFDLGGLSDRWTAVAVLQLLQQKRWQLDDPIARVAADWPKDKAAITWRHLLAHTSGLPVEADWKDGRTARRAALTAIAGVRLIDTPGRACHWSPLNGNLLAILLEQVAGQDFEDVLRKKVFAVAGMQGAACLGDKRLDPKRLTVRSNATLLAEPVTVFPWDWSQRGARGLLASADDLAAFAAALQGTRWLPAKDQAVLLAPLPGGDALRVQAVVRTGVEWTQLHGAVTGFRARLLLQSKARAALVLLAGEQDLDPLEAALTAAFAPALSMAATTPASAPTTAPASTPTPAPAPSDARQGGDALARFVGVFALPNGDRFEVTRQGDGLSVLGLGLEASARLVFGRWPHPEFDAALRAAEDRCLAGLTPLLAGGSPPDRCFADAAASTACAQQMQRIAQRLGRGAELQFAGTELTPRRQSWLRLRSSTGSAWVCVAWSVRGTIAGLTESQEPPPFRAQFRVARADWAVATVGAVPLSLSVEGQSAARVLVLEDPQGLCELRWVGDLR